MGVIAISLVLLPVATLTYSYGAYPAILWLLARLTPQPHRDRAPSE